MDSIFISIFANFYSETITDYLGVIAIVAFGATVAGVLFTLSKGYALKQKKILAESAARIREDKQANESKGGYKKELKEYETECRECYSETVEGARIRFKELVAHARSAMNDINLNYGALAQNSGGESSEEVLGRFQTVSESQWLFLKDELGYVGFKEIEPYLLRVLDRTLLKEPDLKDGVVNIDGSDADKRAADIRVLQKSIDPEKFGRFYYAYLTAVDGYKSFYRLKIKEWLQESNGTLVKKIRYKSQRGISIKDTDQKTNMVRLKNVLDIVDKLGERLESNSSEIGNEDAAFMQILFGGVVLGIVSSLPSWFMEMGEITSDSPSESLAGA